MSAGSPRRAHSQSRTTQGCSTISPQPVTDPTILDSVAGFINEVATYNVPCDTKDQIQWARFEQLDGDAVLEYLDGDKVVPPALILILGYSTGIQVWAIPANGEAIELLSWRHGSVRVLRFLPTPYVVGRGSLSDIYASKRPLMALCDTTTPGPHHCALSFLSLKTGEQVKVIKFKNPILDVLANRRSVVVTFSERIAVFDAFTLEDRLTVTTCYLSPGIYPNPVALGARWMAYAEKKLISNKRSSGGNEGEGVQSYTATVLHAAKSLGKGLRELGETVASSLTGNPSFKPGTSPGTAQSMGGSPMDIVQKGIVTVLDIENHILEDKTLQTEGVVAHFAAHSEAVVCLTFDPSGLLLLTADKRGHDFHLFRIHPHPGGPSMAAVHHLYILHRGDTTARVQDVCFSPDSRWVAVSTLRGTTHVFPITPYGGNVGVRTHATPHVVNRMSRFHRSAGLPVEGRSNSPVSLFEAPVNSNLPYNNPRLPPYPHPTIVHPLAQIRQPLFIQACGNNQQRPHAGRQRLNSSSDENIQVALRLCCCFAPARAWFDSVSQPHDTPMSKQQARPVESLFIMSCHGTLVQYDLDPHHIASIPKEKICDDTPIELTVHAKAEWVLQRQLHLNDVPLPISAQSLNLLPQDISLCKSSKPNHMDDRWLSQVEIVTHAGPHRRLWMGPQFTFKTYTTTSGSPLSVNDAQAIDVGRSKPVNMPVSTTYPILIESGSVSSCEQSPKLLDTYQRLSEDGGGAGELQLKEDLADAMLESPGIRESGGRCVIVSMKPHTAGVAKVVNPLGTVVTVHSDDDAEIEAPEDAVIHENCDEALFRPVVAPKPYLFRDPKPRTVVKPVLKSHTSISEARKVKDEIDRGRHCKPKADVASKIQEVKCEAKIREAKCEAKIQDTKREAKIQETKREAKIQETKCEANIQEAKCEAKILENKREAKIQETKREAKIQETKCEANIQEAKILENKREAKMQETKCEAKIQETKCEAKIQEAKCEAKVQETKFEPPVREEPKAKSQNRSSNKSETKQQSRCEIKIDLTPPKVVESTPAKKSKAKPKGYAFSDRDSDEKSPLSIQEISKKVSEFSSKLISDSSLCTKGLEDKLALNTLITTPDLMDSVDTFDFPLSIKTKRDTKIEESPLPKNDDPLKEDKFEDARDTAESYSPFKTDKAAKSHKSNNYQQLEPEEIVISSEEEKGSTKKPRKPKAKLGVRLSKGKDEKDKDSDGPSVEITLPPPKKTWSNVVSPKPADRESSVDLSEEERQPIIDLPDLEAVEHFTIELPKKSYSTATKQHLFEIDPHEDMCDSTILLPEKIYKAYSSTKVLENYSVLKVEAKLSDDEKQENGSSQAETTESDDSSKVIAMDTEEDSCQPEISKSTRQGTEKTVKRKSKKKKR